MEKDQLALYHVMVNFATLRHSHSYTYIDITSDKFIITHWLYIVYIYWLHYINLSYNILHVRVMKFDSIDLDIEGF